jgi:hypothetical protein
MPQLNIFIFQNITLYSSIAFLICRYIFYVNFLLKLKILVYLINQGRNFFNPLKKNTLINVLT